MQSIPVAKRASVVRRLLLEAPLLPGVIEDVQTPERRIQRRPPVHRLAAAVYGRLALAAAALSEDLNGSRHRNQCRRQESQFHRPASSRRAVMCWGFRERARRFLYAA